MNYGTTTWHEDCDTCREMADHVTMAAKRTQAEEMTTGDGNCGARAFRETESDYAKLWESF